MNKSLLPSLFTLALMTTSAAHAEDLEFLLVNDSSANLIGFHVSPATSNDWEANLLQGGYLAPGFEIGVDILDGLSTCFYDIRGRFSDGTSAEDFGLNLCDLGEYTFTD